jgi:hypothetical protein
MFQVVKIVLKLEFIMCYLKKINLPNCPILYTDSNKLCQVLGKFVVWLIGSGYMVKNQMTNTFLKYC